MGLDKLLLSLDEGVSDLFGQWNLWTSLIATVLVGFLTYHIATRQDPDTHPLLLARQAQGSPVRQPGESPVYRSQAAPHGMPLNAGLNVKDPGASKWARGRDGDLRDVWRQAVAGVQDDGPAKGATGRILTVLGTEQVIEHRLDDVTRQINLVGQHMLDHGASRVAIYLPNSVELIATLFACAFYNLTAVVLPFDQPDDAVVSMLRRSAADTVVTAPGSFPFDVAVRHYPSLRQLVWVVDDGSRHMDWNEVPQGAGGSVNVATWQDIVNDSPQDAGRALPPLEGQPEPRDVTVFWQGPPGQQEEMVRFTAANLVSAVAAQLFAVPTSQRMGPDDLFLPADSLANSHTLVLTLAALFSNASVAFDAAASRAEDLAAATRGVRPTVLVATPAALLRTHQEATARLASSPLARLVHRLRTRKLTDHGVMPPAPDAGGFLAAYYAGAVRPAVAGAGAGTGAGTGAGAGGRLRLRLIVTAERAGAGAGAATTPRLSSAVLSDLRAMTGARVVYALTAAKVAGAVAQTAFFDYRVSGGDASCSHFGAPLTCTEILFRDTPDHKTTDERSQGEIIVRGPCVAGNEAALGVVGMMRDDNTLAYV